jgi:O-antigen/teichoic acid export membrane protein
MPRDKADSVARGATSIGMGRVIATLLSFALMIVITRRSEGDVGVFRTLVTFLIVAETLPLLGTHRWVATQMAADIDDRGRLFASAMAWSIFASVFLAVLYSVLSFSKTYGIQVSRGLLYVALATVPSGALLVEQAALVGIGRSGALGRLNGGESLARFLAGVALILHGSDIVTLIACFAAIRWITSFAGKLMVTREIGRIPWDQALTQLGRIRDLVPNLAGALICATIVRNAPLMILPARSSNAEAGYFAVSLQLTDFAMLAPTVFVMSSTFSMSRYYDSPRGLRRTMGAMFALLAFALLPVVGLTCVLAAPLLDLLFGARMQLGTVAFQVMLLSVPFMAADQVMSQVMVSIGHYRQDFASSASAALTICVVTLSLSAALGALAAALANLSAFIVVLVVRVYALNRLKISKLLLSTLWRPLTAAVISTLVVLVSIRTIRSDLDQRWQLFWAAPGVALYGLILWALGGLGHRARRRVLNFIGYHNGRSRDAM